MNKAKDFTCRLHTNGKFLMSMKVVEVVVLCAFYNFYISNKFNRISKIILAKKHYWVIK